MTNGLVELSLSQDCEKLLHSFLLVSGGLPAIFDNALEHRLTTVISAFVFK